MVPLSSSLSNKKAIPVSRPCNWTLMIFLLWSVMILLNEQTYQTCQTKQSQKFRQVTIASAKIQMTLSMK